MSLWVKNGNWSVDGSLRALQTKAKKLAFILSDTEELEEGV